MIAAISREFAIYLMCGLAAVTVDFAIYLGLLHLNFGYAAAYLAGYAGGTVLSFVLNRSITFRVHDATFRRMIVFFCVAAVGYVTSYVALYLMIEAAGLDVVTAKVLSLVVVVITQFLLNKLVTFSGPGAG